MKYLKPSTIVGLVLLVCVVAVLLSKKARTTGTGPVAPVAEQEAFTGQISHVEEPSTNLGPIEGAGASQIKPPVIASKTNDNQVVAAPAPHQSVDAVKSNGATIVITPDTGRSEIAGDISPDNNPKVKEEPVQDVKVYITAARAELEVRNVPIGERTAKTSIQGNEVIVTFPPKPGERAGDFIVRIDRTTGKVIDTKIWR